MTKFKNYLNEEYIQSFDKFMKMVKVVGLNNINPKYVINKVNDYIKDH